MEIPQDRLPHVTAYFALVAVIILSANVIMGQFLNNDRNSVPFAELFDSTNHSSQIASVIGNIPYPTCVGFTGTSLNLSLAFPNVSVNDTNRVRNCAVTFTYPVNVKVTGTITADDQFSFNGATSGLGFIANTSGSIPVNTILNGTTSIPANTQIRFTNTDTMGVVTNVNGSVQFVQTTSGAYTISVSASPTAGGTLSGGGPTTYGATMSVLAYQNPGYTFVNWTENGAVVSTSAAYTFIVTANRTLVANFSGNVPVAPSGVGATFNPTNTVVSWIDNSNNETGFNVYYSNLYTGPWNLFGSKLTNEVSISGIFYIPQSKYCFKVNAVNAAGSSADSNVACIVPPVPILIPPTSQISPGFGYYISTEENLTTGPIVFDNNGSAVSSGGCTSVPALPAGLTLEVANDISPAGCKITGQATTRQPLSLYTITGSNNNCYLCKYSVPIKIAVGTPPVVGGSAGSIIVGYVNKPLSVSLPNSGGPVDTCLVKAGSSLLPPGINTSAYGYTCTLSGIPVTVYNDTQGPVPPVTLHAENSFGFSDRDVTIRITHSAPKFALSAIYAHNLGSGEFTTGHDILNIGGSVVSCSVSRVSGVSIGVGQLAAVELNGSCLLFGDVDFADNNGKPYVFSVKGTNKIGSDTIKVTVSP